MDYWVVILWRRVLGKRVGIVESY